MVIEKNISENKEKLNKRRQNTKQVMVSLA